MTAQPLNSEPVLGPVEGRGVAEIRADLAQLRGSTGFGIRGRLGDAEAVHRLLADVPALLAEVEAAHRFERSAAVDSARLAAVEDLVEQARKVSPSGSMTVYVGDLEVALGRRTGAVRGIVGARS